MQGFNDIAGTYDQSFTDTKIGKAQRNAVHRFLVKDLPAAPATILEMNCGTGTDAAFLLKKGYQVIATDGSAAMLEETRKKIGDAAGCETMIWDLRTPFPNNPTAYSFAFSDFGGWNCLHPDEITTLAQQLNSLLDVHGKLAVVIMGRKCWWERSYFLLKGDARNRKRRTEKHAVLAETGAGKIPVYYYAPKELSHLLHAYFTVRKIKPVGLFIPPSYLEKIAQKVPFLLSICIFCESIFGNIGAFANYADHYYMLLEKK